MVKNIKTPNQSNHDSKSHGWFSWDGLWHGLYRIGSQKMTLYSTIQTPKDQPCWFTPNMGAPRTELISGYFSWKISGLTLKAQISSNLGVSENLGTPFSSSILAGVVLVNQPFWGTPNLGRPQISQINDRPKKSSSSAYLSLQIGDLENLSSFISWSP
jgi:hypothetical protein